MIAEELAAGLAEAQSSIVERVKAIETWISLHPDRHAMEDKALNLAFKAYEISHAQLKEDVRGLRESRSVQQAEAGVLERFWPLLLAALMFVVGHFWK